jgi:DnaK suppressor protein
MYTKQDVQNEIKAVEARLHSDERNGLISNKTADKLDEAQENSSLTLTAACGKHNKVRLMQLRRAMDMIDKGTFGVCEVCSEEISAERVEIDPSYITCIECASKNERESKHRVAA